MLLVRRLDAEARKGGKSPSAFLHSEPYTEYSKKLLEDEGLLAIMEDWPTISATTDEQVAQLRNIVARHQPHAQSLRHRNSNEAYGEEAARHDFGNEFVDQLKRKQPRFRGDWWQLALLGRQIELDAGAAGRDQRMIVWNDWRTAGSGHDKLEEVHLESAFLRGAHLERAVLSRAHLEYADLMHAHLRHADLRKAHLQHATLMHADLEGARLELAYLDHAGVWHAKGLLFDDNGVDRLFIEGGARDPWSTLRRKYTGPWFFVHLLLLVTFFAPYIGKAIYYTATGRAQEWSMQQYDEVGQRLGDIQRLRELHRGVRERFEQTHQRRRAVWVVLGWDAAWWPLILAIVVIVYNAMRAYLTVQVSMLRDAEERSLTSPRIIDYFGYFHPLRHWKSQRTMRTGLREDGLAHTSS